MLTVSILDTLSPISPSLSTAATRLELLDPTHRGLHRFVPRHQDEIELQIGDPVYVQKEAEDLWCEGGLATRRGIIHCQTQFKQEISVKM